MIFLGINTTHNASAALMKDGKIIFALQEKRFTNIKNNINLYGNPGASDKIIKILKKIKVKKIINKKFFDINKI